MPRIILRYFYILLAAYALLLWPLSYHHPLSSQATTAHYGIVVELDRGSCTLATGPRFVGGDFYWLFWGIRRNTSRNEFDGLVTLDPESLPSFLGVKYITTPPFVHVTVPWLIPSLYCVAAALLLCRRTRRTLRQLPAFPVQSDASPALSMSVSPLYTTVPEPSTALKRPLPGRLLVFLPMYFLFFLVPSLILYTFSELATVTSEIPRMGFRVALLDGGIYFTRIPYRNSPFNIELQHPEKRPDPAPLLFCGFNGGDFSSNPYVRIPCYVLALLPLPIAVYLLRRRRRDAVAHAAAAKFP